MSILVVHDTPILSGHHHSILSAVMEAYGQEFEIVNVVPKMPDKELKKIKPERWLSEHERITDKAREGFDKVLCCGGIAAATVFASPKTVPITRVRGRGFRNVDGKYTVCTFSPTTVVKDTDFFRDLCFDIEKLVTHDGPMEQPEIDIQMVETKADLALLKDLHSASFLSCDIETTALNPYTADLLSIGFGAVTEENEGYVVVIPHWLIGKEVLDFIKSYAGTLVFHNLKFDIQHLWRKWGRFERKGKYADTMLLNWLNDERPYNRYKSHGLKLMARLHFDAPEYDVHMGAWLEEYFRKDLGVRKRGKWIKEYCEEHPEKVRTAWRKWYQELNGEEPEWRGRKVGRDIPLSEVTPAVLATLVPKELLPPPSKERKQEMWDEMMRYMGLDCFYTARLYPLMQKILAEESDHFMDTHERFDIPPSLSLANMELTGAPVDIEYLEKMKADIEVQLEGEMADLRSLVMEHTAHPKGEEFNPNSPKQVEEVLYDKEKGLGLKMPTGVGRYAYKRDANKLTTNSDTLKVLARQVAKDRPAIAKLINLVLSYRVKSKIAGTYVKGLLDRIDPDGRIRGDFNIHGTATARLSGSNPNLQNIPDASHVGYDIRKAYIATPGWTLLDADYSQLELRVAALFSQDEVMIDAYKAGADIHQEVAHMLWKKPKKEITKYERYLAKCMNFGVIYGRGARSIATGPEMDNLVEMSGRSWSNKEIEAYFDKFKVGYADLFKWMDLVKADSMKQQFVQNPCGHRRRFNLILDSERGHIERQTVNTPIQGFAARMTVHALCEMDRRFDPEKQRILFTVHDSIMCECISEKKIIQETSDLIKEIMQTHLPEVTMPLPTLPHAPFKRGDQIIYNLPFVADVDVGPNWGECKDTAEHYVIRDPDTQIEDLEYV